MKKYTIDIQGHKANVLEVDISSYDVKCVIELQEYPGVIGGGETFKEALENVTEALQMFLEVKKTK